MCGTVESLVDKLKTFVEPILAAENATLVDLEIKGRPGNQLVRVSIDCEQGVTLDKCEAISRKVADCFDMEDVIAGRYRLEISSPGVYRPLKTPGDFRRNLNREVEIVLQSDEADRKCAGFVTEVDQQGVTLKTKNGMQTLSFAEIKYGKVKLPW
ncbi:MAG: ribosome maturation factor RimP [Calditrichaeota bacterium]|nr:MAG: ribosome maturation factor RimP [Calditrichota bacterium]